MRKLLLIPAVLMAAPTLASEVEDRPTAIVQTNGLDLASADGQRRLGYRLNAAINEVCQPTGRDIRSLQEAAECRRNAQAEAANQASLAIMQAKQRKARLAATLVQPSA